MQNLFQLIDQFHKFAQLMPQQNEAKTIDQSSKKEFSPKYTNTITPNVPSLNLAMANLAAARSLVPPDKSPAIMAINKSIQYLDWYKTIGAGGNASAVGKDSLIPTLQEMKNIINTGLFGENFIMSLAGLLKLNDAIPQLQNEFTALKA